MGYSSKECLPLYTFSNSLSEELLGHRVRKKISVFVIKRIFRRTKQGNNKILDRTAVFSATYHYSMLLLKVCVTFICSPVSGLLPIFPRDVVVNLLTFIIQHYL